MTENVCVSKLTKKDLIEQNEILREALLKILDVLEPDDCKRFDFLRKVTNSSNPRPDDYYICACGYIGGIVDWTLGSIR